MEQESLTPLPSDSLPPEVYGCLTAVLLVLIMSVVGVAGAAWLITLEPSFTSLIFGSTLAGDIARSLIYGLGLLIPFGLIAVFLRSPRFRLWRGIALALAVAGGHALIAGGMLVIDRRLRWPGIPDAIPPLVVLIYALAVMISARRMFFAARPRWSLITGISLGILVSVSWAAVGALGRVSELPLALLEAVANGILLTVVLTLIFTYHPEHPTQRPFWSTLIAGFLLMAVEPALFATRGFYFQDLMLALALVASGWIAGVIFVLAEHANPRSGWWAAFGFFTAALLVPFAMTSGLEGDWMPDEILLAWGPAMLAGLGITSLLAIVLLAVQPLLRRLSGRGAFTLIPGVLAVVAFAGMYVGLGRTGVQADTFFVVMADQLDTSAARDIAEPKARAAAVYEMLTDHAASTQAYLRTFLDQQGMDYTPYYLVNGIEVEGNPLLRAQIAARPDVARILNSPHARPLPANAEGITIPPDQSYMPRSLAAGVDAIDAEKVWTDLQDTGTGIVVGIADSGVDWHHPAVRSQYLGSTGNHDYTWFDPWEGTSEPTDTGGHGTHTTGTILGSDGIGVAPGAKWIACRNLARNLGNPGYYLDCMQFLFAPFPQGGDPFTEGDPARGAQVTNNSWGCPPQEGCDAITLSIAVENLSNAGQMFVVSAGNDGPTCDTIWAPANAEDGLAVGASDPTTGDIADFSSRGPVLGDGSGRIKPDVTAPGESIQSSVPGGGYASLDGTSMAGPHVAGVVALMWSANPDLIGNIDLTKQIIEETAGYRSAPDLCGADTGTENNVYGYGNIDAFKAVQAALNAP